MSLGCSALHLNKGAVHQLLEDDEHRIPSHTTAIEREDAQWWAFGRVFPPQSALFVHVDCCLFQVLGLTGWRLVAADPEVAQMRSMLLSLTCLRLFDAVVPKRMLCSRAFRCLKLLRKTQALLILSALRLAKEGRRRLLYKAGVEL